MLEKAIEEFNKYVDNYDKTNSIINRKYKHSLSVMDLMGELAFRLNLDKEKIEIARVIGLLHDIGRFEQVKLYNSVDDKNIDHAVIAVDYLFKDGNIRKYVESDKYDMVIEKAIRYHNVYEIPDNLDKDIELFCKMLRDADKIDIYKQEAVDFEMAFNASEITKEVLEDFKNGLLVNKKKVKTDSDSTILSLSMIFDINFEESYDLLVSTDNFDLFLSMVNVSEDSENLWRKVREVCFDKINKGIGD